MLDMRDVALLVIRPALLHITLNGPGAEQLVLGTAMQESGLNFLQQIDDGPAMGLWQMEQATHDDIWNNYLKYHKQFEDPVRSLAATYPDLFSQLPSNLMYAAAMCRIHYHRVPEPIPPASNIKALAAYWKRWYNTPQGKGTEDQFIRNAALCTAPETWS